MYKNLPYHEILKTIAQQQQSIYDVLRSIDSRLVREQQDRFERMMDHLRQLDHRLQVFIDLMGNRVLPHKEWLDNNDLMAMFSIQKSKLYELKRCGYFPVYDLNGKELCRRDQVNLAVLGHPKVFGGRG